VNVSIPPGQFVSLVGPSGCGKSTLLRAILGTHPPREGEIYAEGMRVLRPSRNVGIVYQHYSLYDFMTAVENVAFGLEQDQTCMPYRFFGYFSWRKLRKQHLIQARDMLEKVGLGAAADQYPGQMSGGMRQRVAIAQAVIMQPKVMLLDEPFGALDEATREELQDMLVGFYNENQQAKAEGKTPPYTILIVTHELNEAIYLSDRILGLSQYHTEGHNGATIVYDKKATAFDRNSTRDFTLFKEQREELRRVVFSEDTNIHAQANRTFALT
jgi:NitT/TauT family transport system ATP-binding protein